VSKPFSLSRPHVGSDHAALRANHARPNQPTVGQFIGPYWRIVISKLARLDRGGLTVLWFRPELVILMRLLAQLGFKDVLAGDGQH
jgi:hypothetical protein